MKLTKFLKSKIVVLAILMGGALLVNSCGSDDDDSPVIPTIEKSALQAAINLAETAVSTAVEGTAEGQYVYGSKAELLAAIDLAQGVLNDPNSTQTALDNTVIAINAAIAAFNANAIVPIDPANLVGQWTFDEGAGDSVADFSGNNNTGTFGNAPGFGTGTPTWTTDRYGNENKAISFNEGAKITIPYNSSLNPEEISISVWVNIAEQRNNRFMGLHSWNGFKFEVQDGMKPFFTGGGYDKDFAGGNPLELDTWYHLVVTFGDGHTIFYVNGFEIQNWDDTPGTLATVTGHDLTFGVGSSQYAATIDNYGDDLIIPTEWGNYLNGTLDEVRIYKSVLTGSQVTSIYDTEKVPN